MKTNTIIAILASTASLAAAMEASLVKRFPNAEFKTIDKLNERPAGSIVASLGLPSFVPGAEGIKVLSFGGRMIENATADDRAHQWQVLRSKTASVEDVVAELGNFEEYVVQKGRVLSEIKSAVVDIKLALSEATTDEEKLELYKQGFTTLQGFLS